MRERMIESILRTAVIYNIGEFKQPQYIRFIAKIDMFFDACNETISYYLSDKPLIELIRTKSESYRYNHSTQEFEIEVTNEI